MWYKTMRTITDLQGMEERGKYGMNRSEMESIRGFLVYLVSTYPYMNSYLNGVESEPGKLNTSKR